MTTLKEGSLTLKVPPSVSGQKFDDAKTHGLSHCMKAVDFIIETETHFLFIEFKDPDSAPDSNKAEYIEKFQSGNIDTDLVRKYRDSWIYQHSKGATQQKPIKYFVLIACESLGPAELSARTHSIRSKLPLKDSTGREWTSFIQDSVVFNISSWNKFFKNLPITRVSEP